jgi:hypothetical protein
MRPFISLAVLGLLLLSGVALSQSYLSCSNPKFSIVVMTDGGSTIILDAGPDGGSLTVAGGAAGLVPVPAVNYTQRRQIQICNSTENPTSTSIIKCAANSADGGLQLGVASAGHPIKVGECWPPVSSVQFASDTQIWCIGTMNNSVTAEIVECQ